MPRAFHQYEYVPRYLRYTSISFTRYSTYSSKIDLSSTSPSYYIPRAGNYMYAGKYMFPVDMDKYLVCM